MEELELEAHGRKMKLIIHDRTWCEVVLLANSETIMLGGDCLDKIISKLLISFIPEKGRKHFIYQDMELFTVFTLNDLIKGDKDVSSKHKTFLYGGVY